MYLIELGFWQMATESETKRKAYEAELTPAEKRATQEFYEGDLEEDIHFQTVSKKPQTRGPVFAFNDTFFEMRCGGSEEKRGLITIATLGGIIPIIGITTISTLYFLWEDITDREARSLLMVALTFLMALVSGATIFFTPSME